MSSRFWEFVDLSLLSSLTISRFTHQFSGAFDCVALPFRHREDSIMPLLCPRRVHAWSGPAWSGSTRPMRGLLSLQSERQRRISSPLASSVHFFFSSRSPLLRIFYFLQNALLCPPPPFLLFRPRLNQNTPPRDLCVKKQQRRSSPASSWGP